MPDAAKLAAILPCPGLGPTLILDRLQQVEHAPTLTLMAGRARVLTPDGAAIGSSGQPGRGAVPVPETGKPVMG
jgi:hypothetical protein